MSAVLDEAAQAHTRVVLDRLFVGARTVAAYGEHHPQSEAAALELAEAFRAMGAPTTVQFLGDGVFRDRQLVPVGFESFVQGRQLGHAMGAVGARELLVEDVPSASSLLPLLTMVGRALSGGTEGLDHVRVPGLRWRDLGGAVWGEAGVKVEPELFAVGQVALGVGAAEALLLRKAGPVDWTEALGIVRRLDRALDAHEDAARDALERAPGPWTPARRSVSAGLLGLLVMRRLGAVAWSARCVAHTALVLGLHGYHARDGVPLAHAALHATRLLDQPVPSRSGAEPHRMRVSVLVDRFARFPEDRGAWLGVMGLVELLYTLELWRSPRSAEGDRLRPELLAMLAGPGGEALDPQWVRAVLGSFAPR